MHPKNRYLLLLLALSFAGRLLAGPVLFHTGSVDDVLTDTEFGALLMGGGTEPDDGIEWLLGKAGGGDVVVLRASGSNGYNDYFYSEIGGVNSVRSYVFSSREEAFDNAMLDALEGAELIFLAGGDQAKYLRFWKGTPVQTLINAHLRAGKPIGGTSAGLAVLGDTVYAAYKDSITSKEALKDPFSGDLTLESGFLNVPFLGNVLTDSHFSERGRLGRLLAFQARGVALRGKPLIGIGVDEETALAIDSDGSAQVFSRQPHARVYLTVFEDSTPVDLVLGKPLETGPVTVVGLGRKSTVRLTDLNVTEPEVLSRVQVRDGRVEELVEEVEE
jgi:beta-aspartyl-peptidase (threonine type)